MPEEAVGQDNTLATTKKTLDKHLKSGSGSV